MRYSHLGPVKAAHGKPLARAITKTLRRLNLDGAPWEEIAECCQVSRATLTRAMAGGNVQPQTLQSILAYLEIIEREERAQAIAHARRYRRAA